MQPGRATAREHAPRPPASTWPGVQSGWPRQCELCRQWARQSICSACVARFAPGRPRCPRCALPSPEGRVCGACLRRPPRVDHVIAAVDYGFPWDGLIARFKFRGRPELAATLAQRIVAAIRADFDREGHERETGDGVADDPAAAAARACPAVQCVVPIPLGERRLRERGYNQAWELARRVARRLALPAEPATLVRADGPAHQVGAGRAEREDNLRNAFWVDPASAAGVCGRHVAVVDDVMTTGATVEAAARALRQAGAARVTAWVLARTPAAG